MVKGSKNVARQVTLLQRFLKVNIMTRR